LLGLMFDGRPETRPTQLAKMFDLFGTTSSPPTHVRHPKSTGIIRLQPCGLSKSKDLLREDDTNMMLKMQIGAYKDQHPQMCLGVLVRVYDTEPFLWKWRPGISHYGACFMVPKFDDDLHFKLESFELMLKTMDEKYGHHLPAHEKLVQIDGMNRIKAKINKLGGMIFSPEYLEPSFL
jgi:hypothetical protein